MSIQNGRAFNEWLRSQLKAKMMSQRQLAQQSGVDHSTISRLIRGERTPSLGTATKLARGLREIHDEADTPQYFGLVASTATNPTAHVEYSLRADEYLSEAQVRQVMEYYLAVRMGRLAARPMAVRPGATHLMRFPKRNEHIVRPASPPGLGRRSTLDEDRAEGPAQRGREAQAQQPGAVDVAELGPHLARLLPSSTRRARRDRCAAPIPDRD